MATKPGDINANVGVELNAQGMQTALTALRSQISNVITELNNAGKAAEQAVQRGLGGAQQAAGMINQQLRQISQLQNSMKTAGNVNVNKVFGDITDTNKIGKMAAGWDQFFRGLESGSPTLNKLTTRIQMLNMEAGKILQTGEQVPRNLWDRRLQVSNAIDAYKKIQQAQERFQRSMEQLSPAGQARLNPLIGQFAAAQSRFDQLAGRSNTGPALQQQLDVMKRISLEMEKQVALVRAEDRDAQALLTKTRARAQALLDATAEERRMQLVTGANRYQVLLAGRGAGGQFNDVLQSDPITKFRTNGAQALERSTSAAAKAQIALNSALASNAGADRIQTLINRYQQLQRYQQQSLALAEKESQPGFFGGIVQGATQVAKTAGGAGIGGGLGGIGNLIGRVGAFTVAFRAINAVGTALSEGAAFAVKFEDQLAQLQAISGATGTEMKGLSDNILQVARNSASTIPEIAESAKILAQAGYSAQETSQLLQNVVNLSAASGTTPAESVDILTSALGAFQLQVSDSTHVTDALVTTLNDTKLSANQVQLGLQYLGATAKENNLTFEDLVATLGAAADAGIRSGSTMATGTRQLLIDLQDPSKKLTTELERIGLTMGDVDVKTRGFIPVLDTLRDHGFNAFNTIETRGAAMYEVLANNTEEMRQLRDSTTRQGSAAEAAAKRMDSLNAQWIEFKNRASGAANSLGSLFIPALKNTLQVMNALFDVIGLFVGGLRDMAARIDEMLPAWTKWELHIPGTQQNLDKLNQSVDKSATALNEAHSATEAQRTSIKSIDNEIDSIVTRYDSLSKSNRDTAFEVARLSERFPGLRAEFDKTKGGVDGLIQSMFNLKKQLLETLQSQAYQELSQGRVTENLQRQQTQQTYLNLRSKYGAPSDYNEGTLGARMARILELLAGGAFQKYGLQSIEASRSQGKAELDTFVANNLKKHQEIVEQFQKDTQSLIASQNSLGSTINGNTAAQRTIAQTQFYKSGAGSYYGPVVQKHEAQANALVSQVQGLPVGQRTARVASLVKEVEDNIKDMVATVGRLAKTGNAVATNEAKSLLNHERATLNNLKGVGRLTEEEQREANRKPSDPYRTMTSAEVLAALQKKYPGIVASGYRGPGSSVYDKDSWHSNMPGGHALDIQRLPSGVTIDNVVRFIESLGQAIDKTNKNSFWDERTRPASAKQWTGPHTHVGWVGKSSAADRALQKEADDADRRESKLQQARVQARKRELDSLAASLDNELDLANLEADYGALKAKYDEYAKQKIAAAEAEGKRQGMEGEELAQYINAVKDQVIAEGKQYFQRAAEAMGKSINKYLEDTLKIIETQFQQNISQSKQALARQQGLLQGLDNPRLAGMVPDYTRVIQQRRTDLASQNLQDTTFNANKQKLVELNQLLDNLQASQAHLAETSPALAAQAYAVYSQNVLTVEQNVRDLIVEQANLSAQAEAIALIPTNWNEAIEQAAQAWRITNNAGVSYNQQLWSHLGEVVDSVQGSFSQFFSDVITGTKSVGSAFKDMAKSIIQSIADIMAKVIATQIMKFLLSFIGPGLGGSSLPVDIGGSSQFMDTSGSLTSVFAGLYRGGLVQGRGRPAKRFAMGGLVSAGVPTRDTVPAMLSKNEFVMRRSAVESVGHRLLMDMNNRGANALQNSGGTTVVQSRPVETNVYVVLPEEKPQLGPNDVLAVVHNDALRGGATKTLIKRIARGG